MSRDKREQELKEELEAHLRMAAQEVRRRHRPAAGRLYRHDAGDPVRRDDAEPRPRIVGAYDGAG